MQQPTRTALQPRPEDRSPAGPRILSRLIDPAAEDRYWRENFRSRAYVPRDTEYALLRPAYRFGWESRVRYFDRSWQQAEPQLQRDWRRRHEGTLPWTRARLPARDAWDRVDGLHSSLSGEAPSRSS